MSATDQLFETIRDGLIERLEKARDSDESLPIWTRPWTSLFPKNIFTNDTYQGFNILAFSFACEKRGFSSPWFITYKQCRLYNEKHGTNIHVRKGETHIKGIRYGDNWIPKDWEHIGGNQYQSARHGDIKTEAQVKRPWAKIIQVFNADQLENCPDKFLIAEEKPVHVDIEDFVKATHADIRPAPSAFFSPKEDYIGMPPLYLFASQGHYWATMLHELTHWTGHKSRLERDLSGSQWSSSYAKEELVAEIGSAYLCGYFGLTSGLQHETYIDSYLKVLRHDLNAVRWAATRATDAFNYLHDTIADIEALAA